MQGNRLKTTDRVYLNRDVQYLFVALWEPTELQIAYFGTLTCSRPPLVRRTQDCVERSCISGGFLATQVAVGAVVGFSPTSSSHSRI